MIAALLRYGSIIGLHPEYLCAQVDTMPFASRKQLGFFFLKNSKKKALIVMLFRGCTLGHLGEQRDFNSSVACWNSLYSPVPVNLIL